MEKPNDIYITLYTSRERIESFADGYSKELYLWDASQKSGDDVIPVSVPIKWVWREDKSWYITRKDFGFQF